jgi:hypothetical protein
VKTQNLSIEGYLAPFQYLESGVNRYQNYSFSFSNITKTGFYNPLSLMGNKGNLTAKLSLRQSAI